MKRAKPKPKHWQRKRKHAVQFYIDDSELKELRRQCAARSCNASDYFRSKLKPPKPPKAATPETSIEDPRQVTVSEILEAKTA